MKVIQSILMTSIEKSSQDTEQHANNQEYDNELFEQFHSCCASAISTVSAPRAVMALVNFSIFILRTMEQDGDLPIADLRHIFHRAIGRKGTIEEYAQKSGNQQAEHGQLKKYND